MSLGKVSLNENQEKALLWNEGSLLVLAGPGQEKQEY